MEAKAILALPLEEPNEANAKTIREYLKALLREVWTEQEGFSGKRPFGNSGWDHDLIKPLIKFEVIEGKMDEDGYIYDYDRDKANHAILNAIEALK